MNLIGAARKPWAALVDAASNPYRKADFFAWRYARGKLDIDPVFHYVLRNGLIAPSARVLDIGCGQGLLASLLQACTTLAQQGGWPSHWGAVPAGARVTGIELMERDVARARTSLGNTADFVCGDMRHMPFPEADTVVILDVLHYISVPEQNDVLARVRRALPTNGSLLMRVGDAAARPGFVASQWVDALVTWVRGHRMRPTHCRTLAQWMAYLESLGFDVRSQPMSEGTPFANVLLIAKVRSTT